ncbi:Ubiquinone/menaquinone biosynthesis methyltransferase UBIE [Bacillus cereus]|uniref:Ubiquinone/menaquinone biosynthesis methyltransferase UBIE n=1 Tax=Bacillus cereus TaxID=1396 RepID=A0A164ITA4_BACCE|nr:Ubiquinone/menaquinone biosynthesis methyltransferase UBIE [Bacillus cereus]
MESTQMLALNKKCWDTVAPYFFKWIVYRNMVRIQRLKMRFICSIQSEIKRFLI